MSYCLKTGGLLFDEAYERVFSCDLHIEGDYVIAVTCPPEQGHADHPAVMLIVEASANPFYREADGSNHYGTLVVKQRDCRITERLQKHIEDYYPGYRLAFKLSEPPPSTARNDSTQPTSE